MSKASPRLFERSGWFRPSNKPLIAAGPRPCTLSNKTYWIFSMTNGTMTFLKLDDGTVRIDRADPEVLISAELLDMIGEGEIQGASVGGDEFDEITFVDDYGQTCIYRLGEYSAIADAFYMHQTFCAMAPWGEPS
jgi:hypothetical protein